MNCMDTFYTFLDALPSLILHTLTLRSCPIKGSFGNYMTMAHLEGLRNKCGWGAAFRQVSNWWIPFDNDANLGQSVQSMSVQSKQCFCDLAKVHMVAQRGIAHLMACWD